MRQPRQPRQHRPQPPLKLRRSNRSRRPPRPLNRSSCSSNQDRLRSFWAARGAKSVSLVSWDPMDCPANSRDGLGLLIGTSIAGVRQSPARLTPRLARATDPAELRPDNLRREAGAGYLHSARVPVATRCRSISLRNAFFPWVVSSRRSAPECDGTRRAGPVLYRRGLYILTRNLKPAPCLESRCAWTRI